ARRNPYGAVARGIDGAQEHLADSGRAGAANGGDRSRGAVGKAGARCDRLSRGCVPPVPEPHARQHAVGSAARHRPDAGWSRPRRASPRSAVGFATRAQPLRSPLRWGGIPRGADGAARLSRAERPASAALQLSPGSNTTDPASAVRCPTSPTRQQGTTSSLAGASGWWGPREQRRMTLTLT